MVDMYRFRFVGLMVFALCVICSSLSSAQVQERLDRGIVALNLDEGDIYVGWRLLKSDPEDVAFDVYRENIGFGEYKKINDEPVKGSTNFVDTTSKEGFAYNYKVKLLLDGAEKETAGAGYVFCNGRSTPWYSLYLKDKVTLKRIGIADLDGDGALDFVVQHPVFNVDPYYRPGYWRPSPEPYKLDAYTSKGKFLWRYDMGWSIETGTWYAPYMVFDVDQDGKAEVYAKAGDGDPR